MVWATLILAGLCEVGWAVGLKYSHGLTRLWPSIGTLLSVAASMFLLGISLRALPLGTAYAVWTGIGVIGTVMVGIILFGEPPSGIRLTLVGLIAIGIFGLKFLDTR